MVEKCSMKRKMFLDISERNRIFWLITYFGQNSVSDCIQKVIVFKRKLELYDENSYFIKGTHIIRVISQLSQIISGSSYIN